jgi:hypothetical protein
MEGLQEQVRSEMLRTLLWLAIAMGIGIGIFYLLW